MVAIAELDQLEAPKNDLEREIAELKARLADGDSL
jgi:cell division protein FtsB